MYFSCVSISSVLMILFRLCVNFIPGDSIAIGTMSCFLFPLPVSLIEIYFR